jgi:hypothetical protein
MEGWITSLEAFYLVQTDRAEIQNLCERKERIGAMGKQEGKEN